MRTPCSARVRSCTLAAPASIALRTRFQTAWVRRSASPGIPAAEGRSRAAAHRPAGFAFGQAQHALQHQVDVDRLERARGAGDSRRSTRPASRSTSLSISAVSSRASASLRRASSCAAPLIPASGLRNSCARPFSEADNATAALRRIAPGNSSTGCASQPGTVRNRAQPQVGEQRLVAARESQLHAAQQVRIAVALRQRAGDRLSLAFQRRQRQAEQPLAAHPQPARSGLVGQADASVAAHLQDRGGQGIQHIEGRGRVLHRWNLEQSPPECAPRRPTRIHATAIPTPAACMGIPQVTP
jgi:hypothetical protein